MRKSIEYLLAILFSMLFIAGKSFAQDPNFHIYLLFGQSNMEGAGTIEAQDRITNERVLLLQDQTCTNLNRVYGEWYVAQPPLNRCWSGLGPGDHFGKTMAAGMPSDVTIGLVPAAVSGTDIALYEKSAPIGNGGYNIPPQFNGGYAWLMDLAQRAQTAGVIKGILFHQGETNTADPNWKYTVQQIVSDLRNDLGIGNVPFLAGELLYANYGGCCSSHNPEINQLPGLIANAHVISASGLAGADYAHFTSAAYRELGRRYAQTMLALLGTDPDPDPDPDPDDNNIIVRARGTTGTENLELSVDNTVIGSWTLSTSFQDYAAQGTGNVAVHFTNDNGEGADIQVDYVQIDSIVYQAENQSSNTGVWQNSSCGGSNSEWLHCNGSIIFGAGDDPGGDDGGALGCGNCNWYGTVYPMCCVTTSGWGWENNMSCISEATCASQ